MPLISARRPTLASLADWLARQRDARPSFDGPLPDVAPSGFDLDGCRLELGSGAAVFTAAREALRRWAHCDMGWVDIMPREAPPTPGLVAAMLVHLGGLWFANACRVRDVFDEPTSSGYEHVTLPDHAECGAERFEVRMASDGRVLFEIRAVSRPARWWVAAGRPLVRAAQARFRRDSPAALRRALSASPRGSLGC
ncbi:MAG TPA: DUF1990 domain-containing protein [Planctomycetota bacterium]|nr:DUF1990 domain-containing protein [Planctomycetota bacterium]